MRKRLLSKALLKQKKNEMQLCHIPTPAGNRKKSAKISV